MKSIMGIIYTGERDEQLKELTFERAVAAVPFAGRYRLIDFPLSSMVDSGIRNVGVITQKNYNSLMDHLGSGREWDLHGKRAGLVFLPPFTNNSVGVYSGFLDAIHANLHYLRRSKERYVVSTDTHMLFNARFDDNGNVVYRGAQVLIGGNSRYEAMCRRCWLRKKKEQEERGIIS